MLVQISVLTDPNTPIHEEYFPINYLDLSRDFISVPDKPSQNITGLVFLSFIFQVTILKHVFK